MKLTIGKKLDLGFGAAVVFLITIGVIGIYGTQGINRAWRGVSDCNMLIVRGAEFEAAVLDARSQEKDFLLYYKIEGLKEAKEKYIAIEFNKAIEEAKAKLKAIKDIFYQEESKELARLEGLVDAYAAEVLGAADLIEKDEVKNTGSPEGTKKSETLSEKIKKARETGRYLESECRKIKIRGNILSEERTAQAFRTQNIVFISLIVTIVLAIVLVSFISLFISVGISKSINILSQGAGKAAQGDLTGSISIKRNDEIGLLAKSFHSMLENLRNILFKTRSATSQITSVSNQILTASQQHAAGIEEEAAQVSETATSAKELAITAQQVTEHAQEISRSSGSTFQIAHSGTQAVENLAQGMEKIKGSVSETAQRLEALGKRSQAITEIVTLIDDIAEQTNLLSLNAAIEAARAGEAGKGFAVVAEAIGKLADRTAKSTKDISEIIKDIQQDTASCIMGMEESTKETEQGASLAQEAVKGLTEIVNAVKHMADSTKEIVLASQQQSSGSEQISKAMMSIDEIMRQSSSGAKQSAEAAKELYRMAEELEKVVSQFNLG